MSDNTTYLIDQLDRSLRGESNPAFDDKLKQDAALAEEWNALQVALATIREAGLREQVEAVAKEYRSEKKQSLSKQPAKVIQMNRMVFRVAASFVLLLGISGIYKYSTVNSSGFYADHFSAYELSTSRGEESIDKLEKAYREKNWQEVIAQFNGLSKKDNKAIFLTGQANLELKNYAYATFAPIHYEERYAYPLLVWLHGDAGNEQELRQIMPLVSMRNYVAIAPRGSRPDQQHRGRFDWRQTPEAIECAESRIADSIAVAGRRFNIHPKRIFLVGRDSGGTMAVRVAWNNPNRFAGVAALHGPLPSCQSPLRHVNELRQLPCLLTTSRDSEMYPENRVCDDLRLLHSAGCKVTLRHYPGPDGLTDIMLSDVNNWVMELVCGAKQFS